MSKSFELLSGPIDSIQKVWNIIRYCKIFYTKKIVLSCLLWVNLSWDQRMGLFSLTEMSSSNTPINLNVIYIIVIGDNLE